MEKVSYVSGVSVPGEVMGPSDLSNVARGGLMGITTVSDMADVEGWTPDRYALVLAQHVRNSGVPLDRQRERLAALARIGAGLAGEQASADELTQHYAVLEALFHRFTQEAFEALRQPGARASEVAERFLNAAVKAQRATMGCLSALKVLRDSHQPQPPTAPAAVTTLEAT